MNKRGLSAVIVTLLLVMLSIVLVGVVFVVVQNVVTKGTGQVQSGFDCSPSSNAVQVSSAICNYAGTDCNVTVTRTQGASAIGGVTLTYSNAAGDAGSTVSNITSAFITPTSRRLTGLNASVTNVTSIGASIYFIDKSGTISPCSGQTTFTDVQLVP